MKKLILIFLVILFSSCQIDSPPQYYKPEKKELNDNGFGLGEVAEPDS